MMLTKMRGLLLFLALSLPAFGTTLVFTGGAVDPAANPGFFSLVSYGSHTLTVLAPIGALSVNGGNTYSDSALLVIQTGLPVNSIPVNIFTYNSGSFALYSATDLSLLLFGSLGNGVGAYLQPGPPPANPALYLTQFAGQITGGFLFGSFGGHNLASDGTINSGLALHVSLEMPLIEGQGAYGVPFASALVLTTPEPSTIILLFSGVVVLFRRPSWLLHRYE